jgi:hypothetical protein
VVDRLIDLLSILREYKEDQRSVKILCQLSQERHTNDFDPQVDLEIDGHMIKEVVVDFGSQVNILPRETWIRLGKPLLQPTMNFLKLADQRFIEPIGTLKSVITSIMGIPMRVDFEVINLVEGIPSYPALVDRPWGRNMWATISLERDRIKLKGSGRKIIIPLDPKEGKPWVETWDEAQEVRWLYQVINEQRDNVEPNSEGEILVGSPLSIGQNSDTELYNWKMENYEAQEKECWSIEAIPITRSKSCFSVQVVPIVEERKLKKTLTLILTHTNARKPLWFSERNSLSVHVDEVSKSVGDQGRIQSLVESFTGQATRWWETHAPRLQTWNTTTLYFVEIFGGKQLSTNLDIPTFKPGFDPVAHIQQCEKEWKKSRIPGWTSMATHVSEYIIWHTT